VASQPTEVYLVIVPKKGGIMTFQQRFDLAILLVVIGVVTSLALVFSMSWELGVSVGVPIFVAGLAIGYVALRKATKNSGWVAEKYLS